MPRRKDEPELPGTFALCYLGSDKQTHRRIGSLRAGGANPALLAMWTEDWPCLP